MMPILFPPNPYKQQVELKKEGAIQDTFFLELPIFEKLYSLKSL